MRPIIRIGGKYEKYIRGFVVGALTTIILTFATTLQFNIAQIFTMTYLFAYLAGGAIGSVINEVLF